MTLAIQVKQGGDVISFVITDGAISTYTVVTHITRNIIQSNALE